MAFSIQLMARWISKVEMGHVVLGTYRPVSILLVGENTPCIRNGVYRDTVFWDYVIFLQRARVPVLFLEYHKIVNSSSEARSF